MARLLIFDADPLYREMAQAVFERAGHEATAADSAADCVRRLRAGGFDAVVADLSADLAGGSASESAGESASASDVLAAMRTPGAAPAVIGLVNGGAPSPERRGRVFAAVVAKPFSEADLLAALELALQDVAGRRAAGRGNGGETA